MRNATPFSRPRLRLESAARAENATFPSAVVGAARYAELAAASMMIGRHYIHTTGRQLVDA